MRVISGEKRGLNLLSLDGENTRPTLDRVKETLFNVINFELMDKNLLDVFGGSGSLTIEGLSRRADLAYIIENDKDAIDIINKNIAKAGYEDKCKVFKGDFKDKLFEISKEDIKFSICFIDPPYDSTFYEEVLELLVKYDLLNDDAIIIMEHRKNRKIEANDFILYKEKTFSKNMLSFYKVKGKNSNE